MITSICVNYLGFSIYFFSINIFIFCNLYFGHGCGMWKFLGQASNLHHSGDNAKSLTVRLPGNSGRTLLNFSQVCSEYVAWSR